MAVTTTPRLCGNIPLIGNNTYQLTGPTLEGQAMAIARKYGASVYLPGVENFSNSTLTSVAVNDGSVGGVKGQVIGPELVVNGDFSAGSTGWSDASTAPGAISFAGGVLTLTRSGTYNARADAVVATVAGKSYQLTWSSVSGTVAQIQVGASLSTSGLLAPAPMWSSSSAVFTATGSSAYVRIATFGGIGVSVIDNISVRELGYIATQTTAGFKPLLVGGARNLLTNSVLAGGTAGTVGSGAVAPTGWAFVSGGGTVAYASESITFVASASRPAVGVQVSVGAGLVYTATVTITSADAPKPIESLTLASNFPAGAAYTFIKNGSVVALGTSVTTGDVIGVQITVGATAGTAQFMAGLGANAAATGTVVMTKPQITQSTVVETYVPTTSAAASSGSRPKAWLFDGVDDRLSLSGPFFQMSDDHFVVVCAKPLSTAGNYRLLSNAGATADIRLYIDSAAGGWRMAWIDDAATSVFLGADTNSLGVTKVVSATKQGNAKNLRISGVQSGATSTTVMGAATLATSPTLGNLATGAAGFNGLAYGIIIGKGAISTAELLILERYLGSLGNLQI